MSAKASATEHTIRLTAAAAPDDPAEALENAPIFDHIDGDASVSHIVVIRTDPDEGTLGRMPVTTTELEIKRKWGGGTYQLQGRDHRNRMIKGAFKTITLAGDPIFESRAQQKLYERRFADASAPPPAAAPSDAIGVKEIFALLQSTETKQKAEGDRRALEQEAAHKRELERMKLDAEIKARERAAEDERRERATQEREALRRKEDEERDERRKREAEDREERRRKDDETRAQRDREFQLQLAQLNKKGSADSDLLLKGIQLARDLGAAGGGEGESDPVTKMLAAVLPGVAERFGVTPAKPAAAPAAAAAGAAARPVALSPDAVTLDGPIATTARKAIQHLQSQGFDPEQAIEAMLEKLLLVRKPTVKPTEAAAPAPAAPSSSTTSPPAKATPATKRRTNKK